MPNKITNQQQVKLYMDIGSNKTKLGAATAACISPHSARRIENTEHCSLKTKLDQRWPTRTEPL